VSRKHVPFDAVESYRWPTSEAAPHPIVAGQTLHGLSDNKAPTPSPLNCLTHRFRSGPIRQPPESASMKGASRLADISVKGVRTPELAQCFYAQQASVRSFGNADV